MWLICAATEPELATWSDDRDAPCERFVTGVGVPQTFLRLLPKVLAGDYSLLVNIGIAGAYPGVGLSIGDVVVGAGEVYADTGMELPESPGFLPLGDTAFGDGYREPFPLFHPPELWTPGTPRALGATVSTCTGTDATGQSRYERTGAGFETMEGAAVAQIGQFCGVPVCEIRAISNYCSRRDMRPENIGLALRRLREYFAARART